jgi:hypothetical protein
MSHQASPYRPLSLTDKTEIRLVKIYPGEFNDRPRCELEHVSLASLDCSHLAKEISETNHPDQSWTEDRNSENDHSPSRALESEVAGNGPIEDASDKHVTRDADLGDETLSSDDSGSLCTKEDLEEPLIYESALEDDSSTPYTALSYTWGDLTKTTNILLDGVEFPVTLNLSAFLHHMQTILLKVAQLLPRSIQEDTCYAARQRQLIVRRIISDPEFPRDFPETDQEALSVFIGRHLQIVTGGCDAQKPGEPTESFVYFWIDAICINQENLDEKSHQVARMQYVYTHASSVYIWLEDCSEPLSDHPVAANLISDISEKALLNHNDSPPSVDHLEDEDFPDPRHVAFESLSKVLACKWFTRAWIVQEILSADALCIVLIRFRPSNWLIFTHILLPWGTQVLNESPGPRAEFEWICSPVERLYSMRLVYQDMSEKEGVAHKLQMLLKCANTQFKATKPHDLLYAFHGLLKTNEMPEELKPNYQLPVEKVYHKYEMFIVNQLGTFSTFSCFKRELPGVPSWVTDWRNCFSRDLEKCWGNLSLSRIKVSDDELHLIVDGLKLGEIVAMVSTKPVAESMDRVPLSLDVTYDEPLDWLFAIITGLDSLKQMCLERAQLTTYSVTPASFRRDWERFWGLDRLSLDHTARMLRGEHAELEEVLVGPGGPVIAAIGMELKALADLRGIGILNDGQLVSCRRSDQQMQVGDVICLLKGVDFPCVLHKEGESYSLLGHVDKTSQVASIVQTLHGPAESFTLS